MICTRTTTHRTCQLKYEMSDTEDMDAFYVQVSHLQNLMLSIVIVGVLKKMGTGC